MISLRRLLSVVFLLAGLAVMFKSYSNGLSLITISCLLDIADTLIWKTKGW